MGIPLKDPIDYADEPASKIPDWFTWIITLFVAYVVVMSTLLPMWQNFKGAVTGKVRGARTLLLGQCNAGKTTLFFQLRDQEEVSTVSSLNPLRDAVAIEGMAVDVTDFPGHQRYRGKASDILKEAKCLVYVVDAEDKQRLKDVAEHFYELLTHQAVTDARIPILLACNKCDLPSARTEKFIVEEIEREIEQMRVSRAATLEGQDQAESYLGIDGEKFKLLEHSPTSIEVCRISAKKPQIQPVLEFLTKNYA
mmetsp:Transcript_33614/g.99798  ORF Transcript_33614/g.99798 Transcript_33614/m.99798 type:complete len:252 (-) Transcript_33614:35-790(-)